MWLIGDNASSDVLVILQAGPGSSPIHDRVNLVDAITRELINILHYSVNSTL